jgi:hypothetical protein
VAAGLDRVYHRAQSKRRRPRPKRNQRATARHPLAPHPAIVSLLQLCGGQGDEL